MTHPNNLEECLNYLTETANVFRREAKVNFDKTIAYSDALVIAIAQLQEDLSSTEDDQEMMCNEVTDSFHPYG